MKKVIVVLSSIIISAALLAVESASGANPDFESGEAGWKLHRPNFAVQESRGRNGSRGLVWTSIDPNAYGITSYPVPFRPGQNLKISIWIKDEGLSGGKPVFCIEFYDKKNVYINGVGSKLAPNQPRPVVGEWRLYEAETGPIPPATRKCCVDLAVGKGAKGSCVFDDVSVEVLVTQADGLFFSSVPDDKASSGKVRFTAITYANLREVAPESIDAHFTFRTARGGVRKIKPDTFVDGRAEVVLDVSEFDVGCTRLKFKVGTTDGKSLDERRLSFVRLERPARGKVWFDEHRRMIVDGKPTYPLLVYIDWKAEDDPRAMPALDRSPFRMVTSYERYMDKAKLDRYQEHGIRVIAALNAVLWDCWLPPDEVSAWWDENAFIAGRVLEIKDHPALLAWYLADEPKPAMLPRIRERYKLVKALDKNHPVLAVLCHGRQAKDTLAACDVVGQDCYPVLDTGTEKSHPARLSQAADETRVAIGGTRYDKPFWFVPQSYPHEHKRARFPTYHEMRSMVWQSIACGADGMLFYSLGEMLNNKEKPGYAFEPSWDITCRVAREIRDREEMLLTTEPAPDVSGLPQGVVGRAWQLKGRTMFVAVNTTHLPVSGTCRVGEKSVELNLGGDDVYLEYLD